MNTNNGWKLVPEYPTQLMRDAGNDALDMLKREPGMGNADRAFYTYDAMIGAAPCPTCNDQGAVGNILTAQPCPECTPPASAQPERDWELTCDECDGSGHVFVERQVAELATDVQEFKEECEECEGRGFTIAYEDIPGIDEYVRKSRPVASAQDDAKDEQAAFEAQPYRWLYDWTHSSATGRPDEHYTGFTTEEAHAKKHDNPRAICLAAPQASEAVRDVVLPPLPEALALQPGQLGHTDQTLDYFARAAVLADRQQRAALSAQPGAQKKREAPYA